MNLKETCQMTDQEFAERTKTRAEEVKAVSEALAILSSDDAHDTFTSTFNFIQKSSKKSSSSREKAEKILLKVAKSTTLTAEIEELAKAIATLQSEIAEMQVQLKR